MSVYRMNIYVHIAYHFLTSLVIGVAGMVWLEDIWAVGLSMITGFFIDLDHLLDYGIAYGCRVKPRDFLKGNQFLKNGKVYVLFHGWEILFLVIIAGMYLQSRVVYVGCFSMLFHMISDCFINNKSFLFYSVAYRCSKCFEIKELFKGLRGR